MHCCIWDTPVISQVHAIGQLCQVSACTFRSQAKAQPCTLLSQGELCALDVGQGILHEELIMDGLQDVRTVLESDFGAATVDINFFASIRARHAGHKIFVCPAAP